MSKTIAPPTGVTAAPASATSIALSWVPSPDATDTTLVWRSDSAAGPWQNIADIPSSLTSFRDDGLPPGSTWFYALTVQWHKRFSVMSAVASATTPSGGSVIVTDTEAVPGTLSSRNQVAFDGGTEAFVWQGAAGSQVRFVPPTAAPLDASFPGSWQYVLSCAYDQAKGRFVTMSLDALGQSGLLAINGGPSFKFGDAGSRPQGLIKLKSGGYAGVWTQQADNRVGLLYLSPAGAFSMQYTSFPESAVPVPSAQSAIAQHPADDSVWAFVGRDSTDLIRAVRAHEAGGALVIDWTQKEFLGHIDHNLLDDTSPNGEFPHLEACPDPARGVIQLGYQSHHQQIFSTSPFVKGTWVTIASIKPDTSKTFTFWTGWIERISHFGMVTNPVGLFVALNPLDIPTLTFPKLQVVQIAPGSSGLGSTLLTRSAASAISSLSGRDWLTDKDASGKCHRLALTL